MTAEDFTPVLASEVSSERRVLARFRRRLADAVRAMAAGMAASKDYRHLNAMTDGQLKRIGLTRNDIPREIYRRHLAELKTPAPGSPYRNSGDFRR